jgi:hypothetical protein
VTQTANGRNELARPLNATAQNAFFDFLRPALCHGFAHEMHDDVEPRNTVQRRRGFAVPGVKSCARTDFVTPLPSQVVDAVSTLEQRADQLLANKASGASDQDVHDNCCFNAHRLFIASMLKALHAITHI